MTTPNADTRAIIDKLGEGDLRGWRVFMPPRGPQDFEGDAIKAPYGDTFWPTHADACNFVARVLTEEAVDAEHAATVGKTILVNTVTGYLGDTDEQILDRRLDPPVAFIVVAMQADAGLRHWTDGGWLDPHWDLTPVNPTNPQIADMRSFWCFGPSHNVDGSVNEHSPFVVAAPPAAPRVENIDLLVTFYVRDDALVPLRARAREIDDESNGGHYTEYTTKQALVLVLHNDPDFLFKHLAGWCESGAEQTWDDHAEWVDADPTVCTTSDGR